MHKVIWIGLVLLVVGGMSAKPPTTKPAKKPKPKPRHVSVQQEMMKKAFDAEFDPMIERMQGNGIDWTRSTVFAAGVGKAKSNRPQDVAMARRAARLDAARNAILLMGKIRVDAGGKYPTIKEGQISTDAVLKNFKEVSWEHNPHTKTVKVIFEAPLYGPKGVVKMLGLKFKVERGDAWGWVGEDFGGLGDAVIVDIRGIKFSPSLAPRIVTPTGERIFAWSDIPPSERGKRSAAIYVFMEETGAPRDAKSIVFAPIARAKIVIAQAGSVDLALWDKVRKGFKNPVIVNADATPKDSPGTIVLAPGSLQELAIRSESRKLMRSGRLIIVTDFGARR